MDKIPLFELQSRWQRCRELLARFLPRAEGIIVFSRLNIYYLSGTFGNGLFWLPREGEPVLLCRRGLERAAIESPMNRIFSFRSYKDIESLLKNSGSPMGKTVAAEMNGLSWSLANSFTGYLAQHDFLPGDKILAMTRGTKSAWELAKIREAGKRHNRCLTELLPPLLQEGESELEISRALFCLLLDHGHHGILRMENYGEEVFLGHIAAGDSGNYPSVFNGPVGLRGMHPAVPHMGSGSKLWQTGEALTIDIGFTFEGYHTDKTQVYWLGEKKSIPDKVRAAHDFCIEIQQWIAGQLKPGAVPAEIWEHCRARAGKIGWSEGFMALGCNKVGFVGHGIGLAIDEYPVLAKGFDLPLEEGMVFAVEPKIGIPEIGMVGVENTFEVTSGGGKCLTGSHFDMISIPVDA
ncbi:MAG: Xaa-Pro peptidase family protein [Pseudomonadota bacterium]